MALQSTEIDTTVVRNAIGESSDDYRVLCTSANINKYSKKKPIRDAKWGNNWPAGSNGKYGLNLPTDWSYLSPRGGSPDGTTDEPYRITDFAGYEHTSIPPVYFVDLASIKTTLNPNDGSDASNTFTIICRSAADDKQVSLTELGLQNYYLGIKLAYGNGSEGIFYKTFGCIGDYPTGASVGLDATLISYNATSGLATFSDMPNNANKGTYTWYLFISSDETGGSWTTTAPGTVIILPNETLNGTTYYSTGSFTVADWIYIPEGSIFSFAADSPAVQSFTVYVSDVNIQFTVSESLSWMTAVVYDGEVSQGANGYSGYTVKLTPSANTGDYREGTITITTSFGTKTIAVHQAAHVASTVSGIVQKGSGETFTLSAYNVSTINVGATSITFTATVSNFSAGLAVMNYTIQKGYGGTQVGSGSFNIKNGTPMGTTATIPAAVAGITYYITLTSGIPE